MSFDYASRSTPSPRSRGTFGGKPPLSRRKNSNSNGKSSRPQLRTVANVVRASNRMKKIDQNVKSQREREKQMKLEDMRIDKKIRECSNSEEKIRLLQRKCKNKEEECLLLQQEKRELEREQRQIAINAKKETDSIQRKFNASQTREEQYKKDVKKLETRCKKLQTRLEVIATDRNKKGSVTEIQISQELNKPISRASRRVLTEAVSKKEEAFQMAEKIVQGYEVKNIELHQAIEMLKRETDKKLETKQSELEFLETQLNGLKEEQKLQEEIEVQLTDDKNDLEKQMQGSTRNDRAFRDQVHQANKYHRMVQELKAKLTIALREQQQLQEDLRQTNEELNRSHEILQQKFGDESQRETALLEKVANIQSQQIKKNELTHSMVDLRTKLQASHDEEQRLLRELENARQQLHHSKQIQEQKELECFKLVQNIAALEKQLQETEAKLSEKGKIEEKLYVELASARQRVTTIEHQMGEKSTDQSQQENLELELNDQRHRVEELNQTLEQMKYRERELYDELQKTKEDRDVMQQRHLELQEELQHTVAQDTAPSSVTTEQDEPSLKFDEADGKGDFSLSDVTSGLGNTHHRAYVSTPIPITLPPNIEDDRHDLFPYVGPLSGMQTVNPHITADEEVMYEPTPSVISALEREGISVDDKIKQGAENEKLRREKQDFEDIRDAEGSDLACKTCSVM